MNAKGTGLGLSICKKIITQMGGKVHADSEIGIGTRFIITQQVRCQDRVYENNKLISSIEFDELYSEHEKNFTPNFFKKFELRDYQLSHFDENRLNFKQYTFMGEEKNNE